MILYCEKHLETENGNLLGNEKEIANKISTWLETEERTDLIKRVLISSETNAIPFRIVNKGTLAEIGF